MYTLFYILTAVLVALGVGFVVWAKLKGKDISKIIKVVAIVYGALAFLNLFLPDAFALRRPTSVLETESDPLMAVCKWIAAAAVISLPFAVIFKKKYVVRVATVIGLLSITSIIFAPKFLYYYTCAQTSQAPVLGESARSVTANPVFRQITHGVLSALPLVLVSYLLAFHTEKYSLEGNTTKDLLLTVPTFLAFVYTAMPISCLGMIAGTETNALFSMYGTVHICWIVFLIVEALTLSFIFKNKDYETRYMVLLVMSVSLMMQYFSFFQTDGNITCSRLPLQLCNIASFLIFITLLTKNEKLYHFTVVNNVTGALIAILICDSDQQNGILYNMNIHFMMEHANVFLVPILASVFKIFKPLKKRDVKHFIIGFCIYYFTVMTLGVVFNGIFKSTGNDFWKCNYLFMFNQEKAMGLVGNWIGKLFDWKFSIGNFDFMFSYVFVFVVFLLLCTGMFFLLYACMKEKKNKKEA